MQRLVTNLVVEQEGYGVAEDLTEQSAGQVPEVLSPHLLYAVATRELAEDGVDPVAKAAQERAPLGGGIALLAPVRREEFDARAPRHLFLRLGRAVVLRSPTANPQVNSTSSGTTESSWASAGATEKRVMTPGQQTLTCTLNP